MDCKGHLRIGPKAQSIDACLGTISSQTHTCIPVDSVYKRRVSSPLAEMRLILASILSVMMYLQVWTLSRIKRARTRMRMGMGMKR